jgi:hypothetical protein
MGRPLKIAKYYSESGITLDQGYPNDHTNTNNDFDGDYPGVVGGNDVSLNVVVRVKIGSNSEADGYILRQKAKRKYIVTDGTHTGTCTLVDKNDASLAADEMTVTVTDAGSSTFRLAYLTNKWGVDFNGVKYLLSFFSTATAGSIAGCSFAEVSVENND